MPKLDGLSGGTDEFPEDENEQDLNGLNEDGIDVALLESEVPNRDYAEYLIESIKREVRCEDALVRQIVYTVLSKDSTDPLNLGILAPTSEGKTYPVMNSIKYWDSKDIWVIGSMSPKYLIRMYGKRLDENGEPLEIREGELKRAITAARADREGERRYRIKKKQKDLTDVDNTGQPVIQIEQDIPIEDQRCTDDTMERLEQELKELYEKATTVIELTGKLIVFLEPPHPQTWSIIKPILSHDRMDIEHPYVDKIDGTIHSIRVMTRGWPAVIMCSAKDEAQHDYWAEVQSRFIISSPNMIREKYRQGNLLIAIKAGDPHAVQEMDIIDSFQRRIARECASFLANHIKHLSKGKLDLDSNERNLTWIPFNRILAQIFPDEKGTDNRINSRVTAFLNMVAIARSHLRKRIQFGNESLIIVDLKEDLHEALHISQNNIGMPIFKLERFKEVFVPHWMSKANQEAQNEKDVAEIEALSDDYNQKAKLLEEAKGRTLKEVIDGELMLIVTAKELCETWKRVTGKPIIVQNVTKTYLNEWMTAGLVDEVSMDGRNKKGYYPIVNLEQYNGISKFTPKLSGRNLTGSVLERMNNITQHASLITIGTKGHISKHWIYERLVEMIKAKYFMEDKKSVEIYDESGIFMSIAEFIKQYENDDTGYLIDFFSTGKMVDNGEEVIYDESIFGPEKV